MNLAHELLILGAAAVAAGAVVLARFLRRRARAQPPALEMLSVDQLKMQVDSGAGRVLDVRTPADFNGEQGHIAGALNLPLEELPTRLAELGPDRAQRIAIVCRTDRKSSTAAAVLAAHGFTAALAVRGGMTAWRERGWASTRDSAAN
jgi:rhodanese-related sulfurtransferase